MRTCPPNETTNKYEVNNMLHYAKIIRLPFTTTPWSFDACGGTNTIIFHQLRPMGQIKHAQNSIALLWRAHSRCMLCIPVAHLGDQL